MLRWRGHLRFVRRWLIPFLIILESIFLIFLVWIGFFPSISKEDCVSFNAPFLLSVIEQDIALCDGNRSLGRDRFSFSFF